MSRCSECDRSDLHFMLGPCEPLCREAALGEKLTYDPNVVTCLTCIGLMPESAWKRR